MIKNLILFAFVFVGSLSFANKLCYLGDSQSASKGESMSLFQSIKSTLKEHGTLHSGMAVCGAPISGYLGRSMSGCKYKGVTHLSITNGRDNVVGGRGRTKPMDDICAGTDTVIVQLGDNNLNNSKAAGQDAKKLANKIIQSGKKCVWIGPASIGTNRCAIKKNQKNAVSNSIKAAIEPLGCKFVDSFSATAKNPPKSKDPMCIHYPGLYGQWADAIKPMLNEALIDGATGGTPGSSSGKKKAIR
tara:strand:+ start:4467 stop:5201 length:735 start_codon:yes stop_codon:yes gene_type:complete